MPNGSTVIGPDGRPIGGDPTLPFDSTLPGNQARPDEPRMCKPMVRAPAPLRRLTRTEYVNSVQALLGNSVDAETLSADEKTGTFATNTTTPLSRLGVEQYGTAAESLAANAVNDLGALLLCDPQQMGELACAQQFIASFVRRAYRRAVTADEQQRYETLFNDELARADFTNGIRLVVQTALQSPHFLYHVERIPSDSATASVSAYELASRLSFFLWNSAPDVELLNAAGDGSLATADGLATQVDRMLASPKAKAMIGNFHLQMLGVESARKPEKVAATFPQFDDQVWKAMIEETVNFTDYVVRQGDGKLQTLFSADFSVLDEPLFSFYGVTQPANHDVSTPVSTTDAKRTGLLTLGSFLSTQSHTETTSPVFRGKIIRRNMLCQTLPDPPDDADTTIPPAQPGQTMRDQITTLTTQPNTSCPSCHQLINPPGFSLENFDAIGRLRTQDNGKNVDTTGEVKGLGAVDGPFGDGIEFSRRLSASNDVAGCFTRQWFRFAVGRNENIDEGCELYNLSIEFRANGSNIKWLLKRLATSPSFQRPPEAT